MALITVGIADCKVSSNPRDVLITRGLGSCIAVLLYDPVARVAGLLHYMLPLSEGDADQAIKRPCMFADTGIALLLQRCCRLGAIKSRAVFMAAGGARMLDKNGTFNVGERNYEALQNTFHRLGIFLHKEETGGTASRTVQIDVARGKVHVSRSSGSNEERTVGLTKR
ncbi:MAG TPA: chemotaxis protein CheD [Acidobacteriaceae bacterium]|nr:chemotaxis protein CheD [Acidobacteriaceae bacterium]